MSNFILLNGVEYFKGELLRKFPKFIKSIEPMVSFDFFPYNLFGNFGLYTRVLIESDQYDEVEINEIFNFLNEMGESPDSEVQNLLTVGVLELLTETKKVLELSRQRLKGVALEDLYLIEEYWKDK